MNGEMFGEGGLVVPDAEQVVAAFFLDDEPGVFGIGVKGVGADGGADQDGAFTA